LGTTTYEILAAVIVVIVIVVGVLMWRRSVASQFAQAAAQKR